MSIELSYKWDEETYIEGCKANQQLRDRTPMSRLVSALLVALVITNLIIVYRRGFIPFDLGSITLALYWFLLRWPINSWILRRRFRKQLGRESELHWRIDYEGVTGGAHYSSGHCKWIAIHGIAQLETGFIIVRDLIYHWLPMKAFKTEEDLSWFVNVAKANVPNYMALKK